METHVALGSGVLTTMVDYQTTGTHAAERSLENLENEPNTLGATTYTDQNFERTALLAPVTDRGTLFDVLI